MMNGSPLFSSKKKMRIRPLPISPVTPTTKRGLTRFANPLEFFWRSQGDLNPRPPSSFWDLDLRKIPLLKSASLFGLRSMKLFFSAFGRQTFYPRPQNGVFRCGLNKQCLPKTPSIAIFIFPLPIKSIWSALLF